MTDPEREQQGLSDAARDADATANEDEEDASSPFDHPAFLPVLLWGLAVWFGYDGWINQDPEMLEHVMFKPLGLRHPRRARHLLHDPVDPRGARARREGPGA
jgi:hypothetical protein